MEDSDKEAIGGVFVISGLIGIIATVVAVFFMCGWKWGVASIGIAGFLVMGMVGIAAYIQLKWEHKERLQKMRQADPFERA